MTATKNYLTVQELNRLARLKTRLSCLEFYSVRMDIVAGMTDAQVCVMARRLSFVKWCAETGRMGS